MARINIEVTEEQKRILKSESALAGESMKTYILKHVLPAEEIYNEDTLKAIGETQHGEGLRYFESAEQMFEELHRPDNHPDDVE